MTVILSKARDSPEVKSSCQKSHKKKTIESTYWFFLNLCYEDKMCSRCKTFVRAAGVLAKGRVFDLPDLYDRGRCTLLIINYYLRLSCSFISIVKAQPLFEI